MSEDWAAAADAAIDANLDQAIKETESPRLGMNGSTRLSATMLIVAVPISVVGNDVCKLQTPD